MGISSSRQRFPRKLVCQHQKANQRHSRQQQQEAAAHPDLGEDVDTNSADAVGVANWLEEELPRDKRADLLTKAPKEVRRSVRRAHRGLGHPSRKTFLKTLRLGSATEAALLYAKWRLCPVCEASATPGRPLESSARTRPYGFNQSVGLGAKYLKDADGKQRVALSMVDFGTSWRAAAL